MKTKKVITIVGPTAIGKTALAIKIAQHFKAEIISADSRQFYKEMYIGTAVPSPDELQSVKHHLIQHKSIHETYTVGDFEREALELIDVLFKKSDYVVLVGGSGLYVNAVLKGLDDFPDVPPELRNQLNKQLKESGIQALQEKLLELDPVHYKKIDLNNSHRLIRALEICIGTGKPYSSFLKQKEAIRPFTPIEIGLTAPREYIYERINKRVDIMMANGLFDEAKRLYPDRKLNALQTVGYKELFDHLDHKFSLKHAIEEIKKNTRRFAKRQLTWNRKNQNIKWFDYDDTLNNILDYIQKNNVN